MCLFGRNLQVDEGMKKNRNDLKKKLQTLESNRQMLKSNREGYEESIVRNFFKGIINSSKGREMIKNKFK